MSRRVGSLKAALERGRRKLGLVCASCRPFQWSIHHQACITSSQLSARLRDRQPKCTEMIKTVSGIRPTYQRHHLKQQTDAGGAFENS